MLSLKYIAATAALALVAQPALAAPVAFRVTNLNTTQATVVSTSFCGTLAPTPGAIQPNTTSPSSSTDCGGTVSASRVDYKTPAGTCRFTINTVYSNGSWTPTANALVQSGSPICKIVSQDISQINTTGGFSAVFSIK